MRLLDLKQRPLLEKTAIVALALTLPLILFESSGLFKSFELQFLDTLIRWRGITPSNPEIVLVTVDDFTVGRLGSPLPRRYYSEVLRILKEYGAAAVVIDLFFTEERDRQEDLELARLTAEHGNVVHIFHFDQSFIEGPFMQERDEPGDTALWKYAARIDNQAGLSLIRAGDPLVPHQSLRGDFNLAGHVSLFEDEDGRFRHIPLFFEYHGRIYPALSLVALAHYLEIPFENFHITKSLWGYSVDIETPSDALSIPTNDLGQAMLSFYGPVETFDTYTVLDLLEAQRDIQERRAPRVPLLDFKNKIVFIGNVETGEMDSFVMPFSGGFPGMAMQATALSNFLDGNSLRVLPWFVNLGIAAGLVLFWGLTSSLSPKKSNALCASIFFVILAGFNLLAYYLLFKSFHVAPAMLEINSAVLLAFISSTYYEESLKIKALNRIVQRLEADVNAKVSHIGVIDSRISTQDEQYKVMKFFIQQIERLLSNPSVAHPHPIEAPLFKLLENQKIIEDRLEQELSHWRAEKEQLEIEKHRLEAEISVYTGKEHPALNERSQEKSNVPPLERFAQAKNILENYRTFAQRSKSLYHQGEPIASIIFAAASKNGQNERSPMQDILDQIVRIGGYDCTVLITGETGTGKELVAQALRQSSSRKDKAFVALNCAAIPETLIESELFGHMKGAFTNALVDRAGAFEQANGGTIFLDEIGDLKLDLQAKLLRVLQEKKVRRVGGNKDIDVDVRVIAATNRDLQQLIQREQFRNDLYFRLDVANVHLPPLRERRHDIPHLAHFFLEHFNAKNGSNKRLTEETLIAIILYDLPGNVRELQNLIEKVCVHSTGDTVQIADLPEALQQTYQQIFSNQNAPMWEAIESAAGAEMGNLLDVCQKKLRNGHVDDTTPEPLRLYGTPYENCYDYMKSFIDSKGSLFSQEKREALAKKIIVAMQEQLYTFCKEAKLGKMEHLSRDIEKLLGRTRRMVDNWKKEVGQNN